MARPRQSTAATARAPPPASCCHVMAASPMVQCALHKLGRHGVVAATRPPWAHHGRHTTPCHGRHSTHPPWPPQHWHACHGPHRPQHECTTPPPPHAAMAATTHGSTHAGLVAPWAPQRAPTMGATARLHHGRHSTPPQKWPHGHGRQLPQHALGAMAHRGAVASPLGSLVGATCIGGVFCLFSPLCWVQLRAWFLLGTLTIVSYEVNFLLHFTS